MSYEQGFLQQRQTKTIAKTASTSFGNLEQISEVWTNYKLLCVSEVLQKVAVVSI